jgi:heme-degrading monooxygenase HmoA
LAAATAARRHKEIPLITKDPTTGLLRIPRPMCVSILAGETRRDARRVRSTPYVVVNDHAQEQERERSMHARVTTVQLRPDTVDASIELYQREILPVITAQPGYQGVYLFTDRATGNGVSITLWASEADAQTYETSGTYRQLVAKLAANFAAPPTLATYDVSVKG